MANTPLKSDIHCMAQTVWAEARSEGDEGMLAAAYVIKRRWQIGGWFSRISQTQQVQDRIISGSISAVCRKPWQFSCWNENDPNLPQMRRLSYGNKVFLQAARCCITALETDEYDKTNGATHYMTKARRAKGWPSSWGEPLEPVAEIGNHLFYIV